MALEKSTASRQVGLLVDENADHIVDENDDRIILRVGVTVHVLRAPKRDTHLIAREV